jgi:hypothetical protein
VQRFVLAVVALVAALGQPAPSAAQGLPTGGYYADGAYYVPSDSPAAASAPVAPSTPPACPPGYGVPTMYVATTATMVRIQWVGLVGGDAPGFPYVPVYGSELRC